MNYINTNSIWRHEWLRPGWQTSYSTIAIGFIASVRRFLISRRNSKTNWLRSTASWLRLMLTNAPKPERDLPRRGKGVAPAVVHGLLGAEGAGGKPYCRLFGRIAAV